ncbi:hypothetical protein [Rariglobus hedericola]|uniref:Uncharacterized protein n=1 Tax=Rariglobus hedericola TaxID=2597822 RepID=A0A556QM81_9BACT|nr:hypothetical protein [Rariglobus hedericola]TSJ77759.1 hypothetical protein FPL22_00170 [Rariglobus hedericola]
MKKLSFLILIAVSAFFTTASFASLPTKVKNFERLRDELSELPKNSGPNKISSIVTKLAKLEPKESATYYKTGISKLAATPPSKIAANQLALRVTKIVKKSGLIAAEISKINQSIVSDNTEFQKKTYNADIDGPLEKDITEEEGEQASQTSTPAQDMPDNTVRQSPSSQP